MSIGYTQKHLLFYLFVQVSIQCDFLCDWQVHYGHTTWVTAGYLPVHLIEVVGLLMTIQFYVQFNSLPHNEFRFLVKIDKIVAMFLGHMFWQWCFQGIRMVFGKWPLGVLLFLLMNGYIWKGREIQSLILYSFDQFLTR
jgi:hypothetical protein